MSERLMIKAFMASLIEKAGGFDAAAAVIGARLGHDISKGSISKRQSGQLDWPLIEILALEDAVGEQPVRRWLMQSLPEVQDAACLMQSAGELAAEGGEAVMALTQLAMGKGCRATARKQIADVIDSAKRTAAVLVREEG